MGEFLDYFKQKKNLANLLLLGILVLAIPLGVNLIKQQQILKSRASASAIVFSGPNVKTVNGKTVATKPDVTLEITAPGDSGNGGGGGDTAQTKCGITPWSQIDSELKAAKYDGLYDHSQTELDAYNRTRVCEGGGGGGGNGAPACDASQVNMSVSPSSLNVGDQVTFTIGGTQGSTWIGDSWSGGVDCTGSFWGSKTCKVTSAGNFTWTHTWQNAAPNKPDIKSPQCSKPLQFTTKDKVVFLRDTLMSLVPKGLVGTVYAQGCSTKTCTYSQSDGCHKGNCLDGTENCDTNVNCGYVNGCSSGQAVDCPTGNPAGPSCQYPETCDLGGGQSGVHTCNGSVQGGHCTWDPNVATNCTQCKPSGSGSGKKTYVCDGSIPLDVVTPAGKAGVDYHWTVDCNKQCNSNDDCPRNNFDSNVDPGTSRWCYGFAGSNNSTADWRCLKLVTAKCPTGAEKECGKLTCNIGNQTPDLGDACAVCIDKNSGGDGNRLTDKIKQMDSKFGGCSTDQLINYWCNGGIGSDATKQCASAKTNAACASQCAGAKAPQTTVAFFRLSEDPTALDTADRRIYSPGSVSVPWTFKDSKPGTKTIFVAFYDKDDKRIKDKDSQASIELLGGEPTIASCSLSFEGQNVTYEINGTNFGSDKGGVASDSTPLDIKSWSPTQIKASLANPPTGQSFPITVTNTFGQSVLGQCSAISQVSVGAKVFCSAPSNHDTDNVDLELAGVFKGGKLIKQKVKIDKDGVIQGLDQKLETGKQYKLSLKAPKSLRKTSGVFTAEDGVTTVPNFVLPVGDIFPADGGDSLINVFDHNELVRQWIISADATGRSGDFNLDGRVNSIDWACMRTSMKDNGGSGDDPEPVPGESVASPIPSVNPSPSSSLAP